jgi:hypothetical protein
MSGKISRSFLTVAFAASFAFLGAPGHAAAATSPPPPPAPSGSNNLFSVLGDMLGINQGNGSSGTSGSTGSSGSNTNAPWVNACVNQPKQPAPPATINVCPVA